MLVENCVLLVELEAFTIHSDAPLESRPAPRVVSSSGTDVDGAAPAIQSGDCSAVSTRDVAWVTKVKFACFSTQCWGPADDIAPKWAESAMRIWAESRPRSDSTCAGESDPMPTLPGPHQPGNFFSVYISL